MTAAAPALPRPRAPALALAAAGVAATAVLAIALPLFTYATSLAVFGLAHVASELGYVRRRFAPRLPRGLVAVWAALLAAVVAVRLAGLAGGLPRPAGLALEVGLVAALGATALPLLRAAPAGRRLLGVAVVAALGLGALLAPAGTLLALAVLHNLTPLGFLAEALPPPARRRWLPVAFAALLGLPLLVATGLPWRALAGAGLVAPEWTLLPTGPLADHLRVYVPAAWHLSPAGLHAFSGAVLAQCLHYAAVIHVLPRLAPAPPAPPARRRALLLATGAACGLLLLLFTRDFGGARSVYGLAAAVHAWVEVPVLLAALVPAAALTRPG